MLKNCHLLLQFYNPAEFIFLPTLKGTFTLFLQLVLIFHRRLCWRGKKKNNKKKRKKKQSHRFTLGARGTSNLATEAAIPTLFCHTVCICVCTFPRYSYTHVQASTSVCSHYSNHKKRVKTVSALHLLMLMFLLQTVFSSFNIVVV